MTLHKTVKTLCTNCLNIKKPQILPRKSICVFYMILAVYESWRINQLIFLTFAAKQELCFQNLCLKQLRAVFFKCTHHLNTKQIIILLAVSSKRNKFIFANIYLSQFTITCAAYHWPASIIWHRANCSSNI